MWLKVLEEQAKQQGRPAVARQLGVSLALISLVLNHKYPGDMDRIQKLVEGAYMKRTITCPVLGDIPLNECLAHQANKRTTGNPIRIRLYRACRGGCPHSKLPASNNSVPPPKPRVATRRYDADATINRYKRQAQSEGGAPALARLLADELRTLAGRYNRLLNKEAKS